MLTDSSDLILSTVPETQPSIDFPDMLSPLLKKLVFIESFSSFHKISFSIASCGFNSALSVEFSCEESKSNAFPVKKDESKDLWFGLLNANCISLLARHKIQ